MHVQDWYAQDQASGAIGRTLDGIADILDLPHYTQLRAAVAYATLSGCRILSERAVKLRRSRIRKRWLISIDFGRTEPSALEYLAALPGAEVRIPFGAKVVSRRAFAPIFPFHPKAYAVDDVRDGGNRILGIFLGSGNLTASGLLTGSEAGTASHWLDPTRLEKAAMIAAYNQTSWFEDAWSRADPVRDIIGPYTKLWRRWTPPITEDDPEVVDLYAGGAGREVAGRAALNLASAKALWVEVGELYKNRGRSEAGNQVDLPRGSRVFFGFPAAAVPKNTVFGQVMLKNDNFDSVSCSVRFGNNWMDKVNLPVPGTEGPATYDNSILFFERRSAAADGTQRFRLRVLNGAQLIKEKSAATNSIDLQMRGGRQYGLLFSTRQRSS